MNRKILTLLLGVTLGLTACDSAEDQIEAQTQTNSQSIISNNADVQADSIEERQIDTSEVETTNETSNDSNTGILTISFDFNRGQTPASNQYAVWIEDAQGSLVKTLFATHFTTNGGYAAREDSIPTWVQKAEPEHISSEEMDAISGATPSTGNISYVWDGTDSDGNTVEDGMYSFYLEGTLYWSSRVLYSGQVVVGEKSQSDIPVVSAYSSDDETNRDMIINVSADYVTEAINITGEK